MPNIATSVSALCLEQALTMTIRKDDNHGGPIALFISMLRTLRLRVVILSTEKLSHAEAWVSWLDPLDISVASGYSQDHLSVATTLHVPGALPLGDVKPGPGEAGTQVMAVSG